MSLKRLSLSFVLLLAGAASLQAQYALMHAFAGPAADGCDPYGALVRKGAVLYGMTPFGGESDEGTIFKINADGTKFTLLHSFDGETDGANPYGSLSFQNGKLYGMTCNGGPNNAGVIFMLNTDGTGFTRIHSFAGGVEDGAHPYGSLTFFGGQFYGMTLSGGTGDRGVIFKIKKNATGFSVLHSFTGGETDGAFPQGSLKAAGNKLYGMTYGGGADDYGTIFRVGTTGAGFILLHSFTGGVTDGGRPVFGALVAKGAVLYGMSLRGGAGGGVIFKINKNGEGFALLRSFDADGTDGYIPYGSLIFCGSRLYGLTASGGATFNGTIFRIKTDGTDFELLHSFDQSEENGCDPVGDLLLKGKMLYGMAQNGGSGDCGVIFSYKIN